MNLVQVEMHDDSCHCSKDRSCDASSSTALLARPGLSGTSVSGEVVAGSQRDLKCTLGLVDFKKVSKWGSLCENKSILKTYVTKDDLHMIYVPPPPWLMTWPLAVLQPCSTGLPQRHIEGYPCLRYRCFVVHQKWWPLPQKRLKRCLLEEQTSHTIC